MKKIILILFIFVGISFASVESKSDQVGKINAQKYDKIFQEIGKKRIGVPNAVLNRIHSPFVSNIVYKSIKNKISSIKRRRIVFTLYGLLNNEAKINKKWYKIKDKVYGYRLIRIKNNSVILKNKRKKIELFLRKKDDKIEFTKNY